MSPVIKKKDSKQSTRTQILDFLGKLCAQGQQAEFLLFYLALHLLPDQRVPMEAIFSGKGRGKESLLKLIRLTLGDLFQAPNSQLVTHIQDRHPEPTFSLYSKIFVCPFEDIDDEIPDRDMHAWRDELGLMLLAELNPPA